MYGYAGKILRVDLSKKRIRKEPLTLTRIKGFLGGDGFSTDILFNESRPDLSWLSPDNKIIFMTGPLTANTIMSSRYNVTSKSPLTGIWGQSDAGGFFGPELKCAGFDGIVIEGSSESPVLLYVSNGEAEVRSAKDYWGLTTTMTQEMIKKDFGKTAKAACIGIAGENLVRFANIISDGSRAAGRCGLGAVMGLKKLKTIVAMGDHRVEISDSEKLKTIEKEMIQQLKERMKTLHDYGTTGPSFEFMLQVRNLPIKNWSENTWDPDIVKSIGYEAAEKSLLITRRSACYKCPVGCEVNVLAKPDGSLPGTECKMEYESVVALGPLCLNGNMETIVVAQSLCNDYGIDTIEAGTVIAFAMECYERGIVTKKETGLELPWGDDKTITTLIELIAKRRGFGDILSKGVKGAAEKVGGGAIKYAMHVKGASIPMHDPRVHSPYMAMKYVTSPIGAYHELGFATPSFYGHIPPELTPEKIAQDTIFSQDLAEVVECLIMCNFAFAKWTGGLEAKKYVPELLFAVTGIQSSYKKLLKIGSRIFNMKRDYNVRLGIDNSYDRLPERFTKTSRITEDGKKLDINMDSMLSKYYELRNWK